MFLESFVCKNYEGNANYPDYVIASWHLDAGEVWSSLNESLTVSAYTCKAGCDLPLHAQIINIG